MEQEQKTHSHNPQALALLPLAVFVIFYLGLSLLAGDFYKISMPVAFLVASASAFLLDRHTTVAQKTEIYASGMGKNDIMIMCLIFILAGAFAATAKGMGAVDSAVLIARAVVPQNLLLAGIFLVSCLISLSVGTSCGTIAAVAPIASGMAKSIPLAPALLFGAVIGGAMFGDNLSMISDTTIAATRTQQVEMRDKFFTNLKMVLPAAAIVIGIYLGIGRVDGVQPIPPVTWADALAVLPYCLILILALCGVNVMALLFCGTVLAAAIGIATGKMDLWRALELSGQGALGMSETLIVAILAGGLLGLIRHNGGIDFILQRISTRIRSGRGCEAGIALLVALVNCFTANNTVAIVVSGPIARELSLKFHCNPRRIASILDTTSCAVQGIIPYGAQLLIATGIARGAGLALPALPLLGCLFYPLLIGVMVILWIAVGTREKPSAS